MRRMSSVCPLLVLSDSGELCGDAYVWGNGILGQLGLGVRGSSKGRLRPTLVDALQQLHPSGIADVGAGGNFTVAVTAVLASSR